MSVVGLDGERIGVDGVSAVVEVSAVVVAGSVVTLGV